jgi:Tfp pilus assembly protein PilP
MRVRIRATAFAIVLLALPGCQDDGPVGPTTQDFQAARKELAAKVATGKRKPPVAAVQATPPQPHGPGFASMSGAIHYDAAGRRDPFRSFEWEQLKLELSDADARGPLDQFDVNQLSVVGVVWQASNVRALIQDPSGMSYIVAKGTKIGKNDGRVTRIDDNLVVVKETYVDFSGEETTKDIEMRIRATEGG